jgi:hypothetical protein
MDWADISGQKKNDQGITAPKKMAGEVRMLTVLQLTKIVSIDGLGFPSRHFF